LTDVSEELIATIIGVMISHFHPRILHQVWGWLCQLQDGENKKYIHNFGAETFWN
jgi:hypothetical protein